MKHSRPPQSTMRRPKVARLHLLAVASTVLVAGLALPFVGAVSAQEEPEPPTGGGGPSQLGHALYETGCSSCHGADGSGREIKEGSGGPSLLETGEAGAYFYLSTGRMPLASTDDQAKRSRPRYSPTEIDALVAYVASLGEGPSLPDLDLANADLARGGEVYRANCQACHSASGSGGALSYGRAAPRLGSATADQVAAAVRIGPGEMPAFGADTIRQSDLEDLVDYVEYLDNPEDPGGLPIGRVGPIPEGFVAWIVGMVAFIALVAWIGTRSPVRRDKEKEA